MSSSHPQPNAAEVTANAWHLYQATMDWVRHGEAKAAALLAANATLAAAVLTLDKIGDLPTFWACLTLVLALLSFGLSAWAVLPSLRAGGGTSLIFFDHAARNHKTATSYSSAHQRLLGDQEALVEDLAGQTWNLAVVARNKFLFIGFSVLFFLLAAGSAGLLGAVEVISK